MILWASGISLRIMCLFTNIFEYTCPFYPNGKVRFVIWQIFLLNKIISNINMNICTDTHSAYRKKQTRKKYHTKNKKVKVSKSFFSDGMSDVSGSECKIERQTSISPTSFCILSALSQCNQWKTIHSRMQTHAFCS